jgi:cystathionine beta-lyase/cystathionine gamma-synthase
MRRPSNRQLSCSLFVLTGLWLVTPRAGAQVPQPPAAAGQPSSFVVDSSELGVVPSPVARTSSGNGPATVTTVKARKAKKTASSATTTIQVRVLESSSVPTAGATDATARATDGGAIAESVWAALRKCESGGNYAINSGNGYYGAYQFAAGTWRKLGYSGLPHEASAATQDEAARKLQSQQGWAPWPACTRKLGLR